MALKLQRMQKESEKLVLEIEHKNKRRKNAGDYMLKKRESV
jgi:hypothetical protein